MASTDEQARTDTPATYTDASTQRVTAENGIEYAYRDLGDGEVPLVLLQHFRGNLDNWDPALIDALAAERRVVTFDNVGVGATTGRTPNTRRGDGPRSNRLSRGDGFPASRSARLLDWQLRRTGDRARPSRPAAARRARLFRTTGRSGDARLGARGHRRGRCAGDDSAGIHLRLLRPHQTRVAKRASKPPDASSAQGQPTETNRRRGRPARRSTTPSARGASPTTRCSSESPRSISRCFVANGDSDPMILPRYSYLLAGLLPDARLTIYPDSAHGFLFQHHSQFAADVNAFLDETT